MLISRAFWTARRSRKLPVGSPPPSFAAIVISRLARVNAWPRLASTTAFLCLMPAHLECPDIYSLHSITNMLSAILPIHISRRAPSRAPDFDLQCSFRHHDWGGIGRGPPAPV